MNTSEVLYRAADGLERNGWMNPTTRTLGSAPTCAQVAIGRIKEASARIGYAAERALWTHIGGTNVVDIWRWNDEPDRTAAEVVEVLRACAVIEAARETARLPGGDLTPARPVPATAGSER